VNHTDLHHGGARPLLTMPVREVVTRRTARSISSEHLFAGDREIEIEHHGSVYRLKITRQGKLILNK
jgi:hemin uptake protein HemP